MHHHKLIIFLAFWVLLISHELTSFCGAAAVADEEDEQQQQNRDKTSNPHSATQMLQDYYNAVRRSASAQWEIVKYLINQLEMHFVPPNLDFRTGNVADSGSGGGGAGKTMKTAAEKSFQVSKEAAEETAKSAGKAMGEAAQMTAEKMKGSSAGKHHSHDEL